MTILSDPFSANTACVCEDLDRLKHLISVETAVQVIQDNVTAISDCEIVPLSSAVGRVLTEPVHTRTPSPPFTNSAMDGYAVNTSALSGSGPWRLKVTDRIAAGEGGGATLAAGTAARIFTGAPVPDGATAVVPQEDALRIGSALKISAVPPDGSHIRFAGEEMPSGSKVLDQGTSLRSRHIACAAAAGCSKLWVRRRLRVAILASGNELKAVGQKRQCSEIWDINSPMLAAELAGPDLEVVHVATGADNPQELQKQLTGLLATVDLLITTGGISVGEEDHVKSVIRALGGDILFSGVALKPGKPVSFGRVGSKAWLGLPGNPLSAFVTWHLFGPPLLAKLGGRARERAACRLAMSNVSLQRRPGRCEYRPAKVVSQRHGRDVVDFGPVVHSARVSSLASATGLVRLPRELETLRQGAPIEYLPFTTW